MRKFRVTASRIKSFTQDSGFSEFLESFWFGSTDISKVASVEWGRKNESSALLQYEERFGKTDRCGLFVSKKWPFIGKVVIFYK